MRRCSSNGRSESVPRSKKNFLSHYKHPIDSIAVLPHFKEIVTTKEKSMLNAGGGSKRRLARHTAR